MDDGSTAHVSPPPDRTHQPGHNHTAHRTHPPTAHRTLSPSIPSQSLTLRPPQISPPISPAAAGSHVAASPRSRLLTACACSRPAPASVDAEPCLDDALGHSFCYANSAANPAAAAYSSSSFRHGIRAPPSPPTPPCPSRSTSPPPPPMPPNAHCFMARSSFDTSIVLSTQEEYTSGDDDVDDEEDETSNGLVALASLSTNSSSPSEFPNEDINVEEESCLMAKSSEEGLGFNAKAKKATKKKAKPAQEKKKAITNGEALKAKTINDDDAGIANPHYVLFKDY
ncbi:hypothetical protein QYE76_041647 [Lolium multiflorum]|uniref:Uncharacterized protein n=1 Tax=Lolium multiflorum TaxID=4521 RepID=A0AAD8TDS9_LOLMU|nr:hypothetical protein QYE76_041647 [Lolium multiflorum]